MTYLAILLGILPGLIWVFFYLQEDPHPEPKRLILITFVVGGLMALPVLIFQLLAQDALTSFNIAKSSIIMIVVLALIEEIFKFTAAFWMTKKNPDFDEPIDAMIYIITAALGFATVENLLIMGNIFSGVNAFSLTASLNTAFNAIALRFIGATLLHTLASGLLGYYWAIGIIKKSLPKYLGYGLILAVLIHSVFNYLIIKFQSVNFLIPSLFLILGAIFVLVDFEKLRKMI
ncbi:MAG: PrsW family glutamic-type intramembrane protease [bacterium]|nr:PrsW family glutamic-type intramembrane protease [bacterium]